MLHKFCIVLEHLYRHQGCFFSDIPHISGTCITFLHVSGIFYFNHLAPKLFVHILWMLWKFCIFPKHLNEHQGCFLLDILHISRTCITFVHLGDIFHFGHSKIPHFSGTFIWTLGLSFLNIVHILGTCLTFVCVSGMFTFRHLAAKLFVHTLEILQFPRTFIQAPGLFFFSDIPHIPRTCTFAHVNGIFNPDI